MNGFKYSIVFLLMLFVSCNRRYIRENEGEALFLLYKGIPQRIVGKVSFWKSSSEYIKQEQKYIPDNKLKLLQMFGDSYAVVRLGSFTHAYKVEKMMYQDAGNKLEIYLTNGNVNDMGYPVFVQKKTIKQISILTNNTQIYLTNITLP